VRYAAGLSRPAGRVRRCRPGGGARADPRQPGRCRRPAADGAGDDDLRRGIFWLLAGFTTVLSLVLWLLLEETHPRERRTPFALRHLLAGYASFGRDRVFWPLLVSGSVNFAGLFLYIASAPRIVRQLLHLSAQGFPWLFIP